MEPGELPLPYSPYYDEDEPVDPLAMLHRKPEPTAEDTAFWLNIFGEIKKKPL